MTFIPETYLARTIDNLTRELIQVQEEIQELNKQKQKIRGDLRRKLSEIDEAREAAQELASTLAHALKKKMQGTKVPPPAPPVSAVPATPPKVHGPIRVTWDSVGGVPFAHKANAVASFSPIMGATGAYDLVVKGERVGIYRANLDELEIYEPSPLFLEVERAPSLVRRGLARHLVECQCNDGR